MARVANPASSSKIILQMWNWALAGFVSRNRPVRRSILAALTGFWLCCALFCRSLFYERYWRWLGCFNELGRCFDPESETVATDSNSMYGLLAAVALVLALLTAVGLLRNRPRQARDLLRP
jgi:hypothetical protein